MVREILCVMVGSALGGALRYLTTLLCRGVVASEFIFVATMSVNVVGSFLIGIILGLVSLGGVSEVWRLVLAVGFCGGFTTFSTFSAEALALLKGENYLLFGLYVLGNVILSLLSVWLGYKLCNSF